MLAIVTVQLWGLHESDIYQCKYFKPLKNIGCIINTFFVSDFRNMFRRLFLSLSLNWRIKRSLVLLRMKAFWFSTSIYTVQRVSSKKLEIYMQICMTIHMGYHLYIYCPMNDSQKQLVLAQLNTKSMLKSVWCQPHKTYHLTCFAGKCDNICINKSLPCLQLPKNWTNFKQI